MPRRSVSISGITWEERLLVRRCYMQTHSSIEKTHFTTGNFRRISDLVFEIPERRAGTDLFKQSEPRRHVAPRQWEHLQRSAGLAGRDKFILQLLIASSHFWSLDLDDAEHLFFLHSWSLRWLEPEAETVTLHWMTSFLRLTRAMLKVCIGCKNLTLFRTHVTF